jgi:IS5 family transposase
MLRLAGDQVESLLDELLPVEVRELPAELAVLDRLLADPRLLAPIEQAWERSARGHGRPTIPMASLVRLMVIKQRTGWGYQTLVREVSDSLHLRRFCLVALTQRVPDESTVRKLVRRLGPETVNERTRVVIGKAQRETRLVARAVRIDATVVEADIRYPTDGAGLAGRPGAGPRGPQARRSGAWPDPAGGGSFAAAWQAGAGDLPDVGPADRSAARCGHGAERPGGADPGPVDR